MFCFVSFISWQDFTVHPWLAQNLLLAGLDPNSQRSYYLYVPSSGIKDVHHQACPHSFILFMCLCTCIDVCHKSHVEARVSLSGLASVFYHIDLGLKLRLSDSKAVFYFFFNLLRHFPGPSDLINMEKDLTRYFPYKKEMQMPLKHMERNSASWII